jgi:hypothetical protein
MKRCWTLLAMALLAAPAWAEAPPAVTSPSAPAPAAADVTQPLLVDAHPTLFTGAEPAERPGGFLTGNHNFPRFIGFMSNPIMNIEPRSVTELYPVFLANWASPFPPLPSGNAQLYAVGLNLALTERLSVGLCQGGYAVTDFAKSREGWLNLGGFAQYTLIEDVPGQFLLTVGMRWEAPTGEADVFQGHGPAHLAGYATIGKEFGEFHLLATGGYQFPARSNVHDGTDLFYLNAHLDRRFFGWLYPLVEVNWIQHNTSIDLSRTDRPGFFNLGTFEVTGNLVALAVGFNAVLRPEKLEFGMVYTRSLATQHDFDFNGVLAKMVIRY